MSVFGVGYEALPVSNYMSGDYFYNGAVGVNNFNTGFNVNYGQLGAYMPFNAFGYPNSNANASGENGKKNFKSFFSKFFNKGKKQLG